MDSSNENTLVNSFGQVTSHQYTHLHAIIHASTSNMNVVRQLTERKKKKKPDKGSPRNDAHMRPHTYTQTRILEKIATYEQPQNE